MFRQESAGQIDDSGALSTRRTVGLHTIATVVHAESEVSIAESDSDDSTLDSNGSGEATDEAEATPGFGVGGGLAGTVGGAVLAARRLVSNDDLPE